MSYDFKTLEPKWQSYWKNNNTYKTDIDTSRPKFYVLDMFPYPSGAGLHVGHPLGYIASDIYSRFMRQRGYNVLHPMGYDAFGLPAEQYAIQTGQHPAITTENNVKRYREQLDKIGFSFDWSREVRTCDPSYYKWTQWAFIQMFKHWYDKTKDKARPVSELVAEFEKSGNKNVNAACSETPIFCAKEWNKMSEKQQQEMLLNYRLAYLADTMVNWCAEFGTVLANDEVKDGVSVRGGHLVEQKTMKQWLLRVTAYGERLLAGLDKIEWTDSLKEIQRNWIGKSHGAQCLFGVQNSDLQIEVFTTRPDTIYGSTFMVLAPESEYVKQLVTDEHKTEVENYIQETKKRSERERIADAKKISGQFTGSYAINPFTEQPIPIWISDYVLAGYGTGAIMAVPAHDSRDYAFAKHFQLPIIEVVSGGNISEESYDAKEGILVNSGIINGLEVKNAVEKIINEIEKREIGKRKTNYRLRDAIFSRQRYWGEPFPVYFKDDVPYVLDESELPLELPEVDAYKPTKQGEPPLARADNWKTTDGHPYEHSTMPGFAGSSAYYLRYMDPRNDNEYFSKEANEYWQDVDLYIGGTEHATGHLIYSRFWNKFLFDIGKVCKEEPFRKLINQGMIQGRSNFVYRANNRKYAETAIWDKINDGQLGYKFKRDYRIENNIFAFCCEEKKLVIENSNQNACLDFYNEHQARVKKHGYNLMVISTEGIINNLDNVIAKTKTILDGEMEVENLYCTDSYKQTPLFISQGLVKDEYQVTPIHVDVSIVANDVLDIEAFRKWRFEYENAKFILEDEHYKCGTAVEKMSKSLYNVVNPDEIVDQYGADTLRLYEMFLGPLEQSKPWDTNGIEGVHKFLKKLWRLFVDDNNKCTATNDTPTAAEQKTLHRTIKRTMQDIERFSFNTIVSGFMICVNELNDQKCRKRAILEPLAVLVSSFAPHIAEELWQKLGKTQSITTADYPVFEEKHLIENTVTYPVAFNGKRRFEITVAANLEKDTIEKMAIKHELSAKWIEGKTIRKVIVVPKKMVNIVVG